MKLNLRLLRNMSLSLDTHKKYHIVYCSYTWTILSISDNLDYIMEYSGTTLEDIENENLPKGVYINLSLWELLEHFDNIITDKLYTRITNKKLLKQMILYAYHNES
jgi:hypothetical protein